MANDAALEQTEALINSIRYYDNDVPVVMIPYDNKYLKVAKVLRERYDVELFYDAAVLNSIEDKIISIFGKKLFARPNQFRKQACWFGPFDEFLYLDTDIIVFEKIIDNLNYLKDSDFVCCDYQYLNGIKFLFNEKVLNEDIFTQQDIKGVFNAGFWGSKKGIINESVFWEILEECSNHLDYFDFSQKVSDMPIFNYMVLKKIDKKLNIAKDTDEKGGGSWAGMNHFIQEGDKLIDPNVKKPLKYLHWAGIKIQPGCPYWDIWKYYYDLSEGYRHKT